MSHIPLLIRECILYAQSVAAFHASFAADPDGDGTGVEALGYRHHDRAQQALGKISRTPARTPEELHAKALIVPFLKKDDMWDEHEKAFFVSFGADVKAFLNPITDKVQS